MTRLVINVSVDPAYTARIARVALLGLLIGSMWLLAVPGHAKPRKPAVNRPAPDDGATLQETADAARQARELCFARIHHDTLVFEECLFDFAAKPANSPAAKLGVYYFGWVGAMNSVRMGMQGSTDTAARFLAQIGPLQQRLNISDVALCQTIQGDCDIRVAQVKVQRVSGHKPPARPEDTGHAH